MEQLSDETLQHILGYLGIDPDINTDSDAPASWSLHALAAASKTCRTLQRNACPLLYRTINLSRIHGDERCLLRTLVGNSSLCRFVRNIYATFTLPEYYGWQAQLDREQVWNDTKESDHIYQQFKRALLSTELPRNDVDYLLQQLHKSDEDQQCALLVLLCPQVRRINIMMGGLTTYYPCLSQTLTGETLFRLINELQVLKHSNRPFQCLTHVTLAQAEEPHCISDEQQAMPFYRIPTLESAIYINTIPFYRDGNSYIMEAPSNFVPNSSLRKLHLESTDTRFLHIALWDIFPNLRDLTFSRIVPAENDFFDPQFVHNIDYGALRQFLTGGKDKLQHFRFEMRIHTHSDCQPKHGRISSLADFESIQTLSLPFSSLIGDIPGQYGLIDLPIGIKDDLSAPEAFDRLLAELGSPPSEHETQYLWGLRLFDIWQNYDDTNGLRTTGSDLIDFPPLVDLIPASVRTLKITCADSLPAVESRLDDDLFDLMLDERFSNLVSIDLQRKTPPDQCNVPFSWRLFADRTFWCLERRAEALVLETANEEEQLDSSSSSCSCSKEHYEHDSQA